MPFKRSPLQQLSESQRREVEALTLDMEALWRDLGGRVCECGRSELGVCEECDAETTA